MIRRLLVLGMALIILALVNFEIYKKEQLLIEGTSILLELAPVDPRSLIQGDYMILRYRIAELSALRKVARDGYLVLETNTRQVASFKRIYVDDSPLLENEILLRFRKRGRGIRLGAESYFFQEGHAKYYVRAKYGELRVATNGESILVGLRDAEFRHLEPPPTVESSTTDD